MRLAGEHSVALQAAIEILQTDGKYVERWQVADLYLTIAGLYWEQKKFLRSLLAAGRAVATVAGPDGGICRVAHCPRGCAAGPGHAGNVPGAGADDNARRPAPRGAG